MLQVASSSVFPLLRNMTSQWSPSGSRNFAARFLPGSFLRLAASIAGRCLHKSFEKVARIEWPGCLVLLESSHDHRCSFRGSFNLEIVVGLPQRPERRHGNADVSSGNGVDSRSCFDRYGRAWRSFWKFFSMLPWGPRDSTWKRIRAARIFVHAQDPSLLHPEQANRGLVGDPGFAQDFGRRLRRRLSASTSVEWRHRSIS